VAEESSEPSQAPARSPDWTVDTLYAYFTALFREAELRNQQRFDAQEKAIEAARIAAGRAVEQALNAQQQAVDKAEAAAEKRFASVNEFRGQLSDQVRTFAPREYVDSQLGAMVQRMNDLGDARQAALDEARRIASGLLPREVYEQALIASVNERTLLSERITAIERRLDVQAGRSQGLGSGWNYLIGFLGMVLTILIIVGIVVGTRPR